MSEYNVELHSLRTVMITSCKGGVGKTTVCANLAMLLAMEGHRVLSVDMDMDNRCLDLVLGLENEVLYHLLDVLENKIGVERAIIAHPKCPALHFVAAPPPGAKVPQTEALRKLIDTFRQEETYDYVLLDTPGAAGDILSTCAAVCDDALIVSTGQATAIRGAEQTGNLVCREGNAQGHLLVNQLAVPKRKRKREEEKIMLIRMIDRITLPLIGVVPQRSTLWQDQNRGILLNDPTYGKTDFRQSLCNIAKRLKGGNVPLFDGFHGK